MYKITVQGKQSLLGKEIPILLGGFGENEPILSDKSIAQVHGVKTFHIRESINKNSSRFSQGIDIINLRVGIDGTDTSITKEDLLNFGYSKQEILQSKNLYILSRRGYGKLIKIMNTDKAWEVYEEILDKYFLMEKHFKEENKNINQDFIELNNKVDNLIQQNKTILSTMKKQPDKECIATSGQWCYEQYKKIDRYLLETKVLPLHQNYVILKHIYDSMWLKDKIIIEDYDIRAYGIDSVSKIKVISQHKELRESFEKHLTEIFQDSENLLVENFSIVDDLLMPNPLIIEEIKNEDAVLRYEIEQEILKENFAWKNNQKTTVENFCKKHRDFKLGCGGNFITTVVKKIEKDNNIKISDYNIDGYTNTMDIISSSSSLKKYFEIATEEIFQDKKNFYKPNAFTKIKTFVGWKNIVTKLLYTLFINSTGKFIEYNEDLQVFILSEFNKYDVALPYNDYLQELYNNNQLKHDMEDFIIKYYNKHIKKRANKTIEKLMKDITANNNLFTDIKYGDEVVKF